jgi:succinate dehydrogenase / fumarate reductase cytochrome b subunit
VTGLTPAQTAFLVALGAILVIVALFALLVVARARRTGGGVVGPVARLGRPSIARLEVHRWAFYAHRVSGVAIFAFLALHLVDVGLVAISSALYDEVHALYGTLALRIFEVGLLAGILFHAANGLRLLVIDLVDVGARASERMLWLAIGLTIVLTIPAGAVILAPAFA